MIGQARQNYPNLEFHLGDATTFEFDHPFDAVFSNAALHWINDAEGVVRCVAKALEAGGRFVAEFGGKGNISILLRGLLGAFQDRGIAAESTFFFPSIADYSLLLERHGLETRRAELFDRFTPLEEGPTAMREWLQMFKQGLLESVPARDRSGFLDDVENRLRPDLFRDGRWHVDYRRIRVAAVRSH
jgi:trans-aconitate 2-methyltransferase